RRNTVSRTPASKIAAGPFAMSAHGEIAAPAFVADEIVAAVPADANAVTFFPTRDALAHCIDASGKFMTRNTRILKTRPQTFFDQHVAVTNPAGFNFHAHLSRTGLGNFSFDQFKISAWFSNLRCFHFSHKLAVTS